MDCFDADVLIYAAQPGYRPGERVRALFAAAAVDDPVGAGSVLLIPELFAKPALAGAGGHVAMLLRYLSRLELIPVTPVLARRSATLRVAYGLRTVDAVHLATALEAGADRFITNNSRDFPKTIEGIEITYPDDLPDVA